MRAVGSILHEAPRTFVWENVDFVRRALEIASKEGDELVQSIGGGLHSAVATGTRSGTHGQPFEEDVEQRDRSTEVARTLPAGSIERRFYESLISSAEHSIRWNAESDAELVERRDW